MQKTHDYVIHPRLIVRTPLRATHTSFGEEEILNLLQQTWFREAIYVASPALYKACEEVLSGKMTDKRKKIVQSLTKYYTRMTSRSTPFGLFASCSLAQWGSRTKIEIKERPLRRTRLDMFYLCRLVQELQQKEAVMQKLRYYPNSTIYVLGNEIRYIETTYKNDRRSYRISAVDNSDYTSDVLNKAAEGLTIQQLTEYLRKYDVDIEEAYEFVLNLVTEQLLVPEWEPAITGKEYMYQVLETLEAINEPEIENIAQILRSIEQQLQLLDSNGINEPAEYRKVIELIKSLGVPFEEEKIFQVDAVQGIETGSTLDECLQQFIYDAFELFNAIGPHIPEGRLEQFKKRFRERYEDREVPLAEVMDTETGIGFSEQTGLQQESPLVEDLLLPGNAELQVGTLAAWDHFWLKYLVKAQKENRYSIVLTDKDVSELRVESSEWAPSLSVVFRLSGHGKILVESIGGSSAVNLAGRFTYAHEDMASMVNEICRAEDRNNDEVIMAEILHMPESRTGNVLQHRACRRYEIPYLAKANVESKYRIEISDLLVSVVNDRVVLRSKRLNKEIIPRLSNAHNYYGSELPLYLFLCELQTQGLRQGARFRFGAAENYFRFLPRVEYKKCIIHPATWLLGKKDLERLAEVEEGEQVDAFSIFNVTWNLPGYFVLVDGDNELLVDSNNQLLMQSFIRLIRNRDSVRLTEYIGGQAKEISDMRGGKYNAQFIAIMLKNKASYKPLLPARAQQTATLPVRFFPGSEWVYVKLYCGFKTADRVLTDMILPLTKSWQQQGFLRKWFFIRYQDPRFHLRVRFLLKDASYTGQLMQDLHSAAGTFNKADFISKIQCDTYEREAERYGYDTMELSESMFHLDSVAVSGFLHSYPNGEMHWLWAARIMHDLLKDFGLTDLQKVHFMQNRRDSYAREFGSGPGFKKQLDKKYRGMSGRLNAMLYDHGDSSLEMMLQKRRSSLQPVIGLLQKMRDAGCFNIPANDFLGSHIHMMLNRVFTADARLQEWILYDFMSRHYQSVIARTGQLQQVPVD